MKTCLVCSNTLLRQIRSGKGYVICRTCRVEIEETYEGTTHHYFKSQRPKQEAVDYSSPSLAAPEIASK